MKNIILIIALLIGCNIQAQRSDLYRVVAFQKDNNRIHSESNTVKLATKLHLYIPNAFSPDNDGINDTFSATGDDIDEFNMTVYNRWGEVVFLSTSLNNSWNGNYKGKEAPQDTYVYVIETKRSSDDKLSIHKGTISLLR